MLAFGGFGDGRGRAAASVKKCEDLRDCSSHSSHRIKRELPVSTRLLRLCEGDVERIPCPGKRNDCTQHKMTIAVTYGCIRVCFFSALRDLPIAAACQISCCQCPRRGRSRSSFHRDARLV